MLNGMLQWWMAALSALEVTAGSSLRADGT